MATLKTEPLPDFIVTETDFSAFVAEAYGRPFQYQQMGDMMGQSTYMEFDITVYEQNEEWETRAQEQLDEWLAKWANMPEDRFMQMHAERDHFIEIDVLTWDLHRRGLMQPGNYLMLVSW